MPAWWTSPAFPESPSGVVVASVNYNTKAMIARLLWSLYRFLGDELRSVVVVELVSRIIRHLRTHPERLKNCPILRWFQGETDGFRAILR